MAAVHAAGTTTQDPQRPPVYTERVFVLHSAPAALLTDALEGLWSPGVAGSAGTGGGAASWFVEPDRFFELTAVSFDDVERFAELTDSPLWTPSSHGQTFAYRGEVRPLLAAAERRGVDGSEVWELAAELGDPAQLAVRRRALWLCARDKEPPLGS